MKKENRDFPIKVDISHITNIIILNIPIPDKYQL